jgi:two-component system, response regulator PdtaR
MQAKQLKIAVAEDNADFRKALTALLKALGHLVVCEAGDGAELLQAGLHELPEEERPDLVIVDLDMPIVDGLEAAEHFAKRGIPVILISGHDDVDRVKLEHEPIAARLRKPATIESLSAAIAQAMQ